MSSACVKIWNRKLLLRVTVDCPCSPPNVTIWLVTATRDVICQKAGRQSKPATDRLWGTYFFYSSFWMMCALVISFSKSWPIRVCQCILAGAGYVMGLTFFADHSHQPSDEGHVTRRTVLQAQAVLSKNVFVTPAAGKSVCVNNRCPVGKCDAQVISLPRHLRLHHGSGTGNIRPATGFWLARRLFLAVHGNVARVHISL